jgi:hypothetical protein
MDLGSWVLQSGGMQSFAMKKDDEADDEALVMPEVYFTISFLCDKDPYRILERIAGEWGKTGGRNCISRRWLHFRRSRLSTSSI